jgi:hypothetical protein
LFKENSSDKYLYKRKNKMARNYYLNGESMVAIKGRADCPYPSLTNLGLTDSPIQLSIDYRHLLIRVDAYGDCPPEIQSFGSFAYIAMTLVHFDYDVLMFTVAEAMGSSPGEGMLGHAGTLMGGGLARFGAGGINGWHYVGLNVISATGKPPWRFLNSVLFEQPLSFPLGTERSLVGVRWASIPYSVDPWNGGLGSYGVPIYDHNLDV